MSREYGVAYSPSKREPRRPWVLRLRAHPRWMTVGRYETQEEAFDAGARLARKGDTVTRLR